MTLGITKVDIREFRTGLAEHIASSRPVALTVRGRTVGIFVPTPKPSRADLSAFEQASARLKAAMPLGEGDIDELERDFEGARKEATSAKRKPR